MIEMESTAASTSRRKKLNRKKTNNGSDWDSPMKGWYSDTNAKPVRTKKDLLE
jgi:hypothetical protein